MTRVLKCSVALYLAFIFATFSNSEILNENFASPGEIIFDKTLMKTKCWGLNKTLNEMFSCAKSKFRAIYPGTLWCGSGNISSHPDELGFFKKADECCREHDFCNNSMTVGESKYGLKNEGSFVRSRCSCDTAFYNCLTAARTLTAMKIGFTYFNLLRPKCFDYNYPATCKKYDKYRLSGKKCTEYSFDEKQNKLWQWLDSPDFFSTLNLFGREYFSLYMPYL